MSKLTLTEAGDATNKVTVELSVPADWRTEPQEPASWKMDGARELSLAVVEPGGNDNATRVAKAIKMQYGDLAGATRNEYPDGRAWISRPEGDNTHARMFVPYAGGVVMGVAVLSDSAKLDGVKAAFETLKIAQ